MSELDDLLPLNESTGYLLTVLMDLRPRAGAVIRKQIARLSNGQVQIAPGNLYPTLKRLVDHGLLEVTGETDEDGEVRKLYRISGLGERVWVADQERLRQRQRAAAAVAPQLAPETRL